MNVSVRNEGESKVEKNYKALLLLDKDSLHCFFYEVFCLYLQLCISQNYGHKSY